MPLRIVPARASARLSLCMIVKNESRHLEACLDSVEGVVDEIVLVDTGSTDETIAIAERFGARIVRMVWPDDFSAARNESMRHATGDWVLWLDADERLESASAARLRKVLEGPADGYLLTVRHPTGENPADGLSEQAVFKLFRRHPAIAFRGLVHEEAATSARQAGLTIAESDLAIWHLGHADAPERLKERIVRNLALLRRQIATAPDNAFAQFNLGDTLRLSGEGPSARAHLEASLALVRSGQVASDVPFCPLLYYSLGELEREQGHLEAARAILAEGCSRYPGYPNLPFALGLAHHQAGDWKGARDAFEACLTLRGASRLTPYDPATTGHKSLNAIASCLVQLGDLAGAERYYARSIAEHPAPDAGHWLILAGLQLELAQNSAATQSLVQALEHSPDLCEAWVLMALAAHRTGHGPEALASITRALALEPNNARAAELARQLGEQEGPCPA